MSIWSHVNASFRIDYIQYDRPIWNEDELDKIRKSCMNYEDFSKIILEKGFGKAVAFEDLWNHNVSRSYISDHPDEFLPMGSEGSLQKTVWKNPDKDCLAAYTISIFGDLRDHHSTTDIIEWFKEKCKLLWVRNAVITVYNEWCGTETYTYKESEE